MNVDLPTAQQIEAGRLTQMRLPRDRRPPRRGHVSPVHVTFESDPTCHILITSSHLSRARTHEPEASCGQYERTCTCPIVGHQDTLDSAALLACGHETLETYARSWLLQHDDAWLAARTPTDQPSTLMAAMAALEVLDDGSVMDRWARRWATTSVWVVGWKVQHERPIMLAQPGRLRYRTLPSGRQTIDDTVDPLADIGYTTRPDRALPGEPEVIDHNGLLSEWRDQAIKEHDAARGGRDRPPGDRRAA